MGLCTTSKIERPVVAKRRHRLARRQGRKHDGFGQLAFLDDVRRPLRPIICDEFEVCVGDRNRGAIWAESQRLMLAVELVHRALDRMDDEPAAVILCSKGLFLPVPRRQRRKRAHPHRGLWIKG